MAKKIHDLNERRLDVLRRASKRKLPARIGPRNPELSLCAQLVDSGHLDGWITIQGRKPSAVLDARITTLGEEYLEQFAHHSKPSLWKSSRRNWSRLLVGTALVLGLIAVLISVCKGRETQTAESRHNPNLSEQRLFGVCGMPPVE